MIERFRLAIKAKKTAEEAVDRRLVTNFPRIMSGEKRLDFAETGVFLGTVEIAKGIIGWKAFLEQLLRG